MTPIQPLCFMILILYRDQEDDVQSGIWPIIAVGTHSPLTVNTMHILVIQIKYFSKHMFSELYSLTLLWPTFFGIITMIYGVKYRKDHIGFSFKDAM